MGNSLTLSFVVCALLGFQIACAEPQSDVTIKTDGSFSNYEKKENLKSTTSIGCVGFSELSNKHTPPDIFRGLVTCVHSGDYEKAAQMFILGGVYGKYDTQRVTDATAHQAVKVLQMEALQDLSKDQQTVFQKALTAQTTDMMCKAVREIGLPNYYPRYMIEHGLRAFGGKQEVPDIDPKFQPKIAWDKTLGLYLHCPAEGKK